MKKNLLFLCIYLLVSMFICKVYGLEVKDILGNPVKNKIPFKRIISLYGAHTENLFYLGLDKEIIGVSPHDDYPPKAKTKPKFSYHDSAEKFISARPDLILIRPMIERGYKKLFLKLEKTGITVISLQPTNVNEMFEYWRMLGILTGREKQGEKIIKDFLNELRTIEKIILQIPYSKRKRVFLESIHKKFKTFASDSISMFVLKSAGGINIAKDAIRVRKSNIAFYGKEKILSHANEIDFYISQKGPMNHVTIEEIEKEPGFKAIKAVREGKIFIIDEEILSRPVPRIIIGIKKIGKILYPELFK